MIDEKRAIRLCLLGFLGLVLFCVVPVSGVNRARRPVSAPVRRVLVSLLRTAS
jgi:hypothetical protein